MASLALEANLELYSSPKLLSRDIVFAPCSLVLVDMDKHLALVVQGVTVD